MTVTVKQKWWVLIFDLLIELAEVAVGALPADRLVRRLPSKGARCFLVTS